MRVVEVSGDGRKMPTQLCVYCHKSFKRLNMHLNYCIEKIVQDGEAQSKSINESNTNLTKEEAVNLIGGLTIYKTTLNLSEESKFNFQIVIDDLVSKYG